MLLTVYHFGAVLQKNISRKTFIYLISKLSTLTQKLKPNLTFLQNLVLIIGAVWHKTNLQNHNLIVYVIIDNQTFWLFNHSFQQSWHFGIPGLFFPHKRPLKQTNKMHVNVIYPSPTSSSGCRILAQTDVVREKHLHHQPLNTHA